MAPKGRSARGRGARSGGGTHLSDGGRSNGVPGSSSHSSNPSMNATASGSISTTSQYPPGTQFNPPPPPPAAQPQPPRQHVSPHQIPQPQALHIPQPQAQHIPQPQAHQIPQPQAHQNPHPHAHQNPQPQPPFPEHQPPPPNAPEPPQDYQQLLDALLALPGRERLPLLSDHEIPGVESIWFDWDKGKLSRVVSGIFRKKFDGPYFSWKKTPIDIQERYFRTFARKYNWDLGNTELVREGFEKIAKKRMKGIVSQAKTKGERPPWIVSTLWAQMWVHWNTPYAMDRSSNASQCRNSERGSLGIAKHVSGQKSHLQVQQEMEAEFGHPVSYGEVFMKTHTKPDGTFVDQKAKQVAEAYEKNLEEVMADLDVDGPEGSENSSEQSTHRTLTIEVKNEIFLMCTETDGKGNLFGLGRLGETVNKRKRKESYASSSSSSITEMHEQLQTAHLKIAQQEAENVRRDEELRLSQARIASLEMLVSYLKTNDPGIAAFMEMQPHQTAAA